MTSTFGIPNEWARLREAIVGNDDVAALLTREGARVHLVSQASVRDPLIVVGRHAIEASLRANARRPETLALRPLVPASAERSTVPPGAANEVDGPFLEGGDVLVNGGQVYVGMSGRASNMAGIDWLEAKLGAAFRVIPMALRSNVRHLEDALALLRPGLLIQCRQNLIDGLPNALRDWEAIDVTPEEAGRLATNVLVLEPGRVVVDASQGRLIEELRRRGLDVIALALGGGLRSAHCALWRE